MIGFLIFVIIVFYIILKVLQKTEAIGNWCHLFSDMQHDPIAFYDLVESQLHDKQVPEFYSKKVTISEGGLLSHNRLYLEVSRGDYIFHICAAPWGTGFFFSWWVRQKMSDIDQLLILIPFAGDITVQFFSNFHLSFDRTRTFKKPINLDPLRRNQSPYLLFLVQFFD